MFNFCKTHTNQKGETTVGFFVAVIVVVLAVIMVVGGVLPNLNTMNAGSAANFLAAQGWAVAAPGSTILNASTINGYPVGRPATVVVAASDAPAQWKAQADYVCTGTADDIKIQVAINAVGTNGGTVRLSEGTFYIAAAIVQPSYVTLEGSISQEGINFTPQKGTVFINTVHSLTAFITSANTINSQMAIKNIRFHGNVGLLSVVNGILWYGPVYSQIEGCGTSGNIVNGIEILNTGGGAMPAVVHLFRNEICAVIKCIYLEGNDHRLAYNMVGGGAQIGIEYNCGATIANSNHVAQCTSYGVIIDNGMWTTRLIGEEIESNQGIGLKTSGMLTIISNSNFAGNGKGAIEIAGGSHSTISSSVFNSNSASSNNTYDDIKFSGAGTYYTIQGNHFYNNLAYPYATRYAINENSQGDYNWIQTNEFFGLGTASINAGAQGANTTVLDNRG